MQAWHKKEKAKQIKKGKESKQKQRTEKLARRNPDRIQKQIDELKALEAEGGRISTHDKKTLQELERDLVAVKKAKDAVGPEVLEAERLKRREAAGHGGAERGGRGGRGGARGGGAAGGGGVKRNANEELIGNRRGFNRDAEESDSGESTASSVRDIPMPSGTPPPLPNQRLPPPQSSEGPREPHALPPKPIVKPVQTTYESAPVLRDLRKEAAVLVPAAVKRRLEADRAKKQAEAEAEAAENVGEGEAGSVQTFTKTVNAAPDVDSEMARFQVEMEEEADEDL